MTIFGTSAKYIDAAAKTGPGAGADTQPDSPQEPSFRQARPSRPKASITSTQHETRRAVSSMSGGTDIISCFALANPNGACGAASCKCRGLGMNVEVYRRCRIIRCAAERRARMHAHRSFHADRFAGTTGRREVSRGVFRALPRRWWHGDLCRADRARWARVLRTLRCGAESGRRAHRTAEIYRQSSNSTRSSKVLAIGQDWDGMCASCFSCACATVSRWTLH
jgi:acetoacetyl-CoA synthetase